MRTPTVLKATGLVTAAVVLGLLTVQGTWALWSAGATATPGTVQAADFRVMVSGPGSVSAVNMMDGPAGIGLSGGPAPLFPGATVYTGVELSNQTDAGSDFTIRARITGPPPPAGPDDLAGHLSFGSKPAASLAECPGAGGYVAVGARGGPSVDIAKGGSGVLCVSITLNSTAPSTVQGQLRTLSLPVSTTQLVP